MALALPGVVESTSYGTPAFKVGKKTFIRLHQDGKSLVIVHISMDEREMLMERDPQAFYITDHYRGWPAMLVGLAHVRVDALQPLVEQSWRHFAPKKPSKDA
jgi:hypothetical protein